MTGADLTPELIWAGYCQGYFPMTVYENEIEWLAPRRRALIPIEGIHVSHSLRKVMRKGTFEVTFDKCFTDVIRACIRPSDNWLSEDFVRAYSEVHEQGWAHSCEAWLDGELAGGVYGVAVGSCFCAESMFHRATDASKIALHALVEKCGTLDFTVFDVQIMNPHLKSLGAYEVGHQRYLNMLKDALARTTVWSQRAPS
ncbi:MAG TPA: leucyl/phenylalanyl-tRNA--protein transferase [Fimbriimonadaceae bacterium]|nr:leucyl/phenylalanyl-tRNA--protein transferase [Fimbriimonadaceae bacterium]